MNFIKPINDPATLKERVKQLETTGKGLKSKIVRHRNFIRSLTDPTKEHLPDVKYRYNILEGCLREFQNVIDHLKVYLPIEIENLEEELSKFENEYFSAIAEFQRMILSLTEPERQQEAPPPPQYVILRNENGDNVSLNQPRLKIKLPEVSLPKFDGKIDSWVHFRDMFKSMIIDEESVDYPSKIHYLNGSIPDTISKSFDSVSLNKDGFEIMWKALKDRFDNLQDLVNHHLRELFKQSKIRADSHDDLRKLIDVFSLNLKQLKVLGQEVDKWDMIIINIVEFRLDNETKKMWETRFIDIKRVPTELDEDASERLPTWDELKEFLEDRCRVLRHSNKPAAKTQPNVEQKPKPKFTKSFAINQTITAVCSFCAEAHRSFQCPELERLQTVQEKRNKVNELKLCHNCLKRGHQRSNCQNPNLCRYCNQKHHSVLCFQSKPTPTEDTKKPDTEKKKEESDTKQNQKSFHSWKNSGKKQVILSTAIVNVLDKYGNPHPCRVLLDNGSESSFMSQSMASILSLPKSQTEVSVSGLNPEPIRIKNIVKACIMSRHSNYERNIECLIAPSISDVIPSQPIFLNPEDKIPEIYQLADPFYNVPSKIDLILGAEMFFEIFQSRQVPIGETQLFLKQSQLGWIVCGSHCSKQSVTKSHCGFGIVDDLSTQLRKFWEIESCENLPKMLTPEEAYCEELFVKTTKRDEDGRFIVTLPVKSNITQLPTNRGDALRYFYQLESRLEKQPENQAMYKKFMREYEELGHMELIEDNYDEGNQSFYLPHHFVIKSSSSTTPLRVVFHASYKAKDQLSLNDCFCVGATVQPDLVTQLLRSRKHKVYMRCDVQKMYRQIRIPTEQQNLQKIFWRNSKSEPVRTYRLKTVTYGTAPAANLATRCLLELANLNAKRYPITSQVIRDHFFVDDLSTGTETVEKAKRLLFELNEIFGSVGMKLRKWMCNRPEVLASIPVEDQEECTEDKFPKTLGLIWNPIEDYYSIDVKPLSPDNPITKRIILSESVQTFDPTGEFNPVILKTKILLQRLWEMKVNWDDPLPQEIQDYWNCYRENIPILSQVKLERYLLNEDFTEIELHGFADASESAYGACVYLRSKNSQNHYKMSLLTAKSRVAPLQKQTLARLELCAAELLAVLTNKVVHVMEINFAKQVLWSDSTIALSWIATSPSKLHTFVANRVSRIQMLTHNCEWRHVRGQDNPADILSRGCNPAELRDMEMWWKGPDFLQAECLDLAVNQFKILDDLPEMKPERAIVFKLKTPDNLIDNIVNDTNDLRKINRAIAWILRFTGNARKTKDNRIVGQLKAAEMWEAEKTIIRHLQKQCLRKEYEKIQGGLEIDNKSRLKCLSPFIDTKLKDGLLRVGGRIKNSDYSYGFKHQILLPEHKYVENMITEIHRENLHVGQRTLLSILRHRFWILRARDKVRKVCRSCITCAKVKPTEIQQMMGNMPSVRLTPVHPFQKVGVDFAGPINIKFSTARNASSSKAYISLFICMATKATHLELVNGLTTEAFIAALDRFFSVRGYSSEIYSDNGTNFVGTNNEFKKIAELHRSAEHQEQVTNHCTQKFVDWKFIPPRAPHFGGIWESQVKVVKHFLERILGDSLLTFEELYTVLKKIEAIMNSRPLTQESEDPSDLRVLTPGHFLIGRALIGKPERDLIDVPLYRLTRYQRIQNLTQHFWKRFQSEYISQLQQRTKNYKKIVAIKPGDLVMLKDDSSMTMNWTLGRILETYPGNDGITRVVLVKTKNGTYTRPVTKIALLPMEEEASQEQAPEYVNNDLLSDV